MKKLIATIALTTAAWAASETQVVMETSMGDLTITLHEEAAPITVENFLKYVDDGFYEGIVVHRIEPNFVIQAGGYDANLNYITPTYPGIQNESDNGLANERGTLSMARTSDPNSANSQFFINLVNNSNLNGSASRPGYAVFATVVEGMDVVDAIASVETRRARELGGMPTPVEPVIIKSVRRLAE
ncbi:peptidylprolyl isomerase [Salinibius halmophilus]|uniref:peptidylprolyl isomerase n=1 Tax=Salinibius halmophilus TaxID=1853216 RepID=UPI000E667A49|nr:peptidylprolyl isomerase [Salinibius halmophilus]